MAKAYIKKNTKKSIKKKAINEKCSWWEKELDDNKDLILWIIIGIVAILLFMALIVVILKLLLPIVILAFIIWLIFRKKRK